MKNKIKDFLVTKFEKELLDAAYRNLDEMDNKLRFNNYSYVIRELLRHFLDRLSPKENVIRCSWYKNENPNSKEENPVTRKQRMRYAIMGVMPNDFLFDTFNINAEEEIDDLGKVINNLSKYTHINDKVFNLNNTKVDDLVRDTETAFVNVINKIQECRKKVHGISEEDLTELFEYDIIEENMGEIDCLSTHSSVEYIYTYDIKVCDFNEHFLYIEALGIIEIELQYGNDGDLRRGDGYVKHERFPISAIFKGEISDIKDYTKNLSTDQEKNNPKFEYETSEIDIDSFFE